MSKIENVPKYAYPCYSWSHDKLYLNLSFTHGKIGHLTNYNLPKWSKNTNYVLSTIQILLSLPLKSFSYFCNNFSETALQVTKNYSLEWKIFKTIPPDF